MHSSRMCSACFSCRLVWGGVCLRGVSTYGGCLPRDMCVQGVSAQEGVSTQVSTQEGMYNPLDQEADTPYCMYRYIPPCPLHDGIHPSVNRMTDRQVSKHYLTATSFAGCKNQ